MPIFVVAPSDEAVHRVGREPDPWAWAPWDVRGTKGRWDDPYEAYRVLYAGDSAAGCFVEVLACLRADEGLLADLDEIAGDLEDEDFQVSLLPGRVPRDWCVPRRIGRAKLAGEFVDIGHAETISALRPRFLSRAMRYQHADFDAAAVRSAHPRDFTMGISRFLYEAQLPGVGPAAGIRYLSRHGDHYVLWGIFERPDGPPLSERTIDPIDPEDQALVEAMRLHNLVWEG